MEEKNTFKFSMDIPTRWNDLDALGHVNNIYYFEYFQIARGYYMPTVCKQWDWNKDMFVIAHIECDYMKELTLRSKKPTIHVRVSSLSNKSFEMEYMVTSTGKDGEMVLHAKGKSVQVMVDIVAKKSMEIPQWLRESIENYES